MRGVEEAALVTGAPQRLHIDNEMIECSGDGTMARHVKRTHTHWKWRNCPGAAKSVT